MHTDDGTITWSGQLTADCPTVFDKLHLSDYDVPLGWRDLVKKLSEDLEKLNGGREFPLYAAQVKEKFGGLRFYVYSSSNEQDLIIQEAEAESYKICEDCGAPGVPRSLSWMRTLCDEHYEERGGDKEAEENED